MIYINTHKLTADAYTHGYARTSKHAARGDGATAIHSRLITGPVQPAGAVVAPALIRRAPFHARAQRFAVVAVAILLVQVIPIHPLSEVSPFAPALLAFTRCNDCV